MFKGENMDEEIYIEKKISCPSCKTGIEFAIKLKNVNLSAIKMNTKCSNCGTEIILTPTSVIGIVEEKIEKNYLNEMPMVEKEYEEIEPTGDINSFFEEVEDKLENSDFDEVQENKKKREFFNDIFS